MAHFILSWLFSTSYNLNCNSRAKYYSKAQNSHIQFDAITRRLPEEKNVVLNEESLLQKIEFFQETTPGLRTSHHCLWERVGDGSRACRTWVTQPAALCSIWETTKVNLNSKNAAKMRCEPLPLPRGCQQPEMGGFDLRVGCRNQKLLLEVLNSFSLRWIARLGRLRLWIC